MRVERFLRPDEADTLQHLDLLFRQLGMPVKGSLTIDPVCKLLVFPLVWYVAVAKFVLESFQLFESSLVELANR